MNPAAAPGGLETADPCFCNAEGFEIRDALFLICVFASDWPD